MVFYFPHHRWDYVPPGIQERSRESSLSCHSYQPPLPFRYPEIKEKTCACSVAVLLTFSWMAGWHVRRFKLLLLKSLCNLGYFLETQLLMMQRAVWSTLTQQPPNDQVLIYRRWLSLSVLRSGRHLYSKQPASCFCCPEFNNTVKQTNKKSQQKNPTTNIILTSPRSVATWWRQKHTCTCTCITHLWLIHLIKFFKEMRKRKVKPTSCFKHFHLLTLHFVSSFWVSF